MREEFNENFAAIDSAIGRETAELKAAKAECVFGTYIGNGAYEQHIELGRQPKAVYLCNRDGGISSGYVCMGLFGPGVPLCEKVAVVDATGFTVAGTSKTGASRINDLNRLHHYIAFF